MIFKNRVIFSTFIMSVIFLLLPKISMTQKPPSPERYQQTMAKTETDRAAFQKKWQQATERERMSLTSEARDYILNTLITEIFPAWYGMPWTMAVIQDGLKPDASYPGEKGKGISCSWFVVRTLENTGFRFLNNRSFAGTIAVHFQKTMTPEKKNFHRLWNITPGQLHDRFVQLGDGLYIIGLNCHIGFVSVKGGRVDFIHSNYLEPYQVVREPLKTSEAIRASQSAGYVVSNLFKDDFLIHHWILGQKIAFQKP